MSQSFEARGKNGEPLFIEVIVGVGTARDLRNWLLEAAYAAKTNGHTAIALLFQSGFTPERLASELAAFKGVIHPKVANRVHVMAIDGAHQIGAVLGEHVDGQQMDDLTKQIAAVSTGVPRSSSMVAVQFLLLHRWLRGMPPIRTADLAVQSGASAPTVSAAIKAIDHEVQRTRDRRVSLKGFSIEAWRKWLNQSGKAQAAKFVDQSGAARRPEFLAKRLMKMGRKDLAIGGVLAGVHYYPALDITGAPRLDILVHGTHHADLSFMQVLDPGLVRDDSAKYPAVVVHFTNRHESHFEVGGGHVWADSLDCLDHMWQAGLMHQVEDFVEYLGRRVREG